jgi:cytochrome c oxidase subunit II
VTRRALLWLLLCAASAPASAAPPMNYLEAHGANAAPITPLTWAVLIVSLAVIAVISGLLVAGLIRTRQRYAAEHELIKPQPRDEYFIFWGVGVTALVLLATVIWTMLTLSSLSRAPQDEKPLALTVTARQWWWEVRYQDEDPARSFVTANEIHLPVGQRAHVLLVGGDVIHSFWIPQLAGKTDVIPGQRNETWLHASKPGVYRGQCGEYCGRQHANMGLFAVAQTPEDYDAWRAAQLKSPPPPQGPEALAEQEVFFQKCGVCHAVRGTRAGGVLGPDLSHFASRETIGAGVLPNTSENLAAWIEDPQRFKPGCFMPKHDLTPEELGKIVGFVQSLK